jgi:cytochrome bd-type quinol oxidase subunit 2
MTPAVFAQDADIQAGLCSGANFQFTDNPTGADCSSNVDATTKNNKLIRQVINIFSVIVGVTAVIMIIVGGFRYITSGGSDASVTSAKNTILYAIIGLIIVALSQLIVRFVLNKLTTGT